MLRIAAILLFILTASLISGQDTYLLDSITSVAVNALNGFVRTDKFHYDDSCRITKHEDESYTTTYLYDENSITIDVTNTFSLAHLTTTIEHYTDFDSLISRAKANILGLTKIDSFFYDEDHNLIRQKEYKFDEGVQYLKRDSRLTIKNGLIESDSVLIYNSLGVNTYYEINNFKYDQNGNEILHLFCDNYSIAAFNKDSIVSIYVDGRISAKHEFIFYNNQLVSESKLETSYSDEYTSTDLFRRFDQNDPYEFLQRTKFHHVDEQIYDYDSAWLYRGPDENIEILASRLTNSWIYNDSMDTLEIRQFQQHFDENQNVTFTVSNRKQYFKKYSELPGSGNPEKDDFSNYPNPSKLGEPISIKANQLFDQVLVTNQIGQQLSIAVISPTNTYEISTSDFIAGIYYISLWQEGKQITSVKKQIVLQ